ncbi:YkgJ family cysteine cluster protein, partial [Pseudomonas chlororaphis]|uniref:YkgJ family cysteine cluster protein n=1 Tax=Pseudomonas chlororaphis TaxID=587753 RepID=UPI003C172004
SSCVALPGEVKIKDRVGVGIVDEFERGEPVKNIAKRLQKEGIVERYNQKSEIFTLQRMSNNDCLYLDRKSRLCTIYDKRPE